MTIKKKVCWMVSLLLQKQHLSSHL